MNDIEKKNVYNLRNKVSVIFSLLFFALPSLFFIIIGYNNSDVLFLQLSVLFLFTHLIIYSFKREYIGLFAYVVCFGMFLLNRIFISMFDPKINIIYSNNMDIMKHLYLSLYIGLLLTYIGFYWGNRNIKVGLRKIRNNIVQKPYDNDEIRKIAKMLFYLTTPFYIIVIIEKIIYVRYAGSYYEYYTEFRSAMPTLIKKIAELNEIFFFRFPWYYT